MSTVQVSVRIDKTLKQKAAKKAQNLGISLSGLYKLFLANFVQDENFLQFQFDQKTWDAYFAKQKTFRKLTKQEQRDVQEAKKDISAEKTKPLQQDQTILDVLHRS